MTKADGIRALILYIPALLALVLWLARPHYPRQFAACLVSALWAFPPLLILQMLNQGARWWTFAEGGLTLRGMPLELYFAWVILWSIVPALAFPGLAIRWIVFFFVALDLVLMPLCTSVLTLNSHWYYGEGFAIVIVLLPAVCVARWTACDTHVSWRAAMQVAISAMIFLFFIPELIFALRPGTGWAPLLRLPSWILQLALQAMFVISVPGLGAVMEFAARGQGTPIPYDAPKRLVTSGIYRYCANPMQLSCAAAMFAWAAMLQNIWMAVAALISLAYSAGIAEWDEAQDLSQRFGEDWRAYRRSVQSWRLRWRPFHAGAVPQLYIASTCEPCSELRRWLEKRRPFGLAILDAETLPAGSITRMRYDPCDGSAPESGVRAFGRALEHLNFGWALVGIALRLPIVWQSIQLVLDAFGLGPRSLARANDRLSGNDSLDSTMVIRSECGESGGLLPGGVRRG